MRKRYREGQEDQLSAFGLVTNAVVLWNTMYTQAALDHLRAEGLEVRSEDVARLSPLQHKRINVLGRYSFALAEPIAKGELYLEEWDILAWVFVPLIVTPRDTNQKPSKTHITAPLTAVVLHKAIKPPNFCLN